MHKIIRIASIIWRMVLRKEIRQSFFHIFWPPPYPVSTFLTPSWSLFLLLFLPLFCPLVDGEVICEWPLQHGFKLHTVADLVNICQKNIKSFWDWILSQWPLIRWIFFFFRLHTALSSIICFSLAVVVFVVLEWFKIRQFIIYYACLLVHFSKWTTDQASDVPSIFFS